MRLTLRDFLSNSIKFQNSDFQDAILFQLGIANIVFKNIRR